jgi:acylphosphatase
LNSVGAHLRVCGLVQGVGYRYFCLRKALSLQLTGWVRNESDGSVSVLVEGDRGAIEVLIEDLKAGPPAASVSRVDVQWRSFSGGYHDFQIGTGHRHI